jgi:hypothetical protein
MGPRKLRVLDAEEDGDVGIAYQFGTSAHKVKAREDELDQDAPCHVCGDEYGEMYFCDGCNRCEHFKCHDPPITKKLPVSQEFYCNVCISPLVPDLNTCEEEQIAFKAFGDVVKMCGGWPQDTSAKGSTTKPKLHNTILSMEAMRTTVWYKKIAEDINTGYEDLYKTFLEIVPHKMASINELIYNNKNLLGNHRSTMLAYAMWCGRDDKKQATYAMDSAEKAANFLRYYVDFVVLNRKHKKKMVSEAETAYNTYRNAVAPLERFADIYGYPQFGEGLYKHTPVKAFEAELMRLKNKACGDVQDYAATSRMATKTLTFDEKNRMVQAMWSGTSAAQFKTYAGTSQAQMRDLLLTSLLDLTGRRGEDLRAIRLPMIMMRKLDSVVPVPAYGIGASIRMVKERVSANETMLTWTRTTDRMICPIGALATYMVWLNDVDTRVDILGTIRQDLEAQEEFYTEHISADGDVEIKERLKWQPEWWHMYMVFSKNPKEPISSSTHIIGASRIQDAGDVKGKTAKTQIHRSSTAIKLVEGGMSIEDVEMFQGWRHTTATDVYVRSAFKTGPLLAAAGWENPKEYLCWWETPPDELAFIPACLLQKVMPNLDELVTLARECYTKYELDMSSVRFLETLVYLRRVFLEDAVMKQPLFPDFPAYTHSVFMDPAWKVYAEEEAKRVEERARLWEVKRSNPVLAASLQKEMDRRMVEVDKKLAELEELRKVTVELNSKKNTPEPEATVHEMLTFKDNDMRLLYGHWRRYHKYFMEHTTSMPWAKAFAEKNARKAQAVRFCKLKPWLYYMDDLMELDYDTKEVLDKMCAIATTLGKLHPVFVKDVFYMWISDPAKDPAMTETLTAMFTKMDLPLPA